MTVANTLVTPEAAYLVTDGGWTDLATRRLMDIKDKVYEVEGTHTVLTALGGAWVAPYVHMDAIQQGYRSFDELVSGIARRLPETIKEVHQQVPGAPAQWGEFALFMVGWHDGPCAKILHVNDKTGTMSLIDAPRFKAVPVAVDLKADAIEASAVRMLKAQRKVHTREGVVASGFVQLTTITGSGITRKVLHRWPDVVGELPLR